MLANMGLDWCQAPDAVGADASKLGSGSGARHPLRGGRMLANRGLDLVPGTCWGGRMLANWVLDLVPGTRCGGGGC
jgi:hypothetical protein